MAKAPKKTETPEVETPEVTPEATEAPATVADVLGAITDLGELEKQYKAMRKTLKATASAENKVAAIDLVADAADELVDDLLASVEERGMKFTNFTVRYVAKDDTGKGYADARGIKTVIGAVRMTADELSLRDEFNAAEYDGIVSDQGDATDEEQAGIVAEFLEAHPSFTVPVEESDEDSTD